MKAKKLSIILSLALLLTTVSTACTKKEEPIVEPEAPVVEEPLVLESSEEQLNEDLSNIKNLDQFPDLTSAQKEALLKNKFFVSPAEHEQPFYVYEANEYTNIPSFITTDSVLHVYHIFYDYTLRTLEQERLYELAKTMTGRMLEESLNTYKLIFDPELKQIQAKNIAFFAVGAELLEAYDLHSDYPEEAMNMASEELVKIKDKAGFTRSAIFPFEMDYSQYIPRGHYTRSEELEKYFLAMMWYGQVSFPLYNEDKTRNTEQTLQAILTTDILIKNEDILEMWEKIYTPTNFFVGSSDDLGIYDYAAISKLAFGENPTPTDFIDSKKLDKFYEEADKLPEPKIQTEFISIDSPSGKQFRFMGQRYIMDSEMIQRLVEPILRPIPSGLDVMAVLGSDRAKEIQLNDPSNKKWEDYPIKLEELKDEFSKYEEKDWKRNLYTGWMWTLTGLIYNKDKTDERFPEFMKNQAWIDKSLSTALGSWAELKHDTVLYGKQSGAEMGGWEEQMTKGYIEPSVDVYERLLWLTKYSRDYLKEMDLEISDIDVKMERFEWLLDFLLNTSKKELAGETLTDEEYDRIKLYGGILEDLASSFIGDGLRWFEISSETDRHMAAISDYHTIGRDGVMEVGVGPAYEIYVVVPIEDELVLTKGAVFSFYEFPNMIRLTDEQWQQMLKDGTQPDRPEWTNSFILE
ncbi:MAG: DUF3160 domain-containing protein [Gudongella sp.]|nr:DUF3160 domain-containing protein [Gudongella sp.]